MKEYWRIAVEVALDEAGLDSTPEQRETVLECIINCRNNESTGCGYDVIGNPGESVRVQKLEDKLKGLRAEVELERQRTDNVIRRQLGLNPQDYIVDQDGWLSRLR